MTSPGQISAVIRFAKDKNVRLVVNNTRHDVSGKSRGDGALSIWTHNLKSIEWVPDFTADQYHGPTFRVGARVSLGEFYHVAEDHGVAAVGGDCSVRVAQEGAFQRQG